MSDMMKVAGKMTPNGVDYVFVETFMTSGYMSLDGTTGSSTGLEYTQKIPVAPGDVINAVSQANPDIDSPTNMRIITCFLNGEAVSAKGENPGTLFNTPFTIPSGVDEVVVTVQSGYTHFIRIKPATSRAMAFAVAEDGKVLERHEWETKKITIATNYTFEDTSTHAFPTIGTPAIDISGYALVSIRIVNTTNVPITLGLYSDLRDSDGRWLADSNGNNVEKVLQSSTPQIITADDIPQLNYMNYLRVHAQVDSVPESGNLNIVVVLKR